LPQQQHASVVFVGHVGGMLHGWNGKCVPPMAAHSRLDIRMHDWNPPRQHAPGVEAGHGNRAHTDPPPPKSPPPKMHEQRSVWKHKPLGSQHAPDACVVHGAGHGLGEHTPLGKYWALGGTAHAAGDDGVQLPRKSQHAPVLPPAHGPPVAQMMPGVGTPPA